MSSYTAHVVPTGLPSRTNIPVLPGTILCPLPHRSARFRVLPTSRWWSPTIVLKNRLARVAWARHFRSPLTLSRVWEGTPHPVHNPEEHHRTPWGRPKHVGRICLRDKPFVPPASCSYSRHSYSTPPHSSPPAILPPPAILAPRRQHSRTLVVLGPPVCSTARH
jgi:hypothetical protein